LLGRSLLGRSLLGGWLLGRSLLGRSLLRSGLLRGVFGLRLVGLCRSLLGRGLLGGRLLGRSLLGGGLLRRGLLRGVIGLRFVGLCRSLLGRGLLGGRLLGRSLLGGGLLRRGLLRGVIGLRFVGLRLVGLRVLGFLGLQSQVEHVTGGVLHDDVREDDVERLGALDLGEDLLELPGLGQHLQQLVGLDAVLGRQLAHVAHQVVLIDLDLTGAVDLVEQELRPDGLLGVLADLLAVRIPRLLAL